MRMKEKTFSNAMILKLRPDMKIKNCPDLTINLTLHVQLRRTVSIFLLIRTNFLSFFSFCAVFGSVDTCFETAKATTKNYQYLRLIHK